MHSEPFEPGRKFTLTDLKTGNQISKLTGVGMVTNLDSF